MLPGRRQRQIQIVDTRVADRALKFRDRDCKRPTHGIQTIKGSRPSILLDQLAEPFVPNPTLKGRDIDSAEILSDQRNRSLEVGWMITQVSYDASAMRTIQERFALDPIAPIVSKDLLLLFLSRPVMKVGFGHGQKQGSFIIGQTPWHGDQFTAEPDRTKSLVVEVVDDPHLLDELAAIGERWNLIGGDSPQSDFESIGSNVFGMVGMCNLTEVFQLKGFVGKS